MGGEMPEYRTISIRLPFVLYSDIRDAAKQEYRSMNQQMIVFLKEEIDKRTTVKEEAPGT